MARCLILTRSYEGCVRMFAEDDDWVQEGNDVVRFGFVGKLLSNKKLVWFEVFKDIFLTLLETFGRFMDGVRN